MLHIILQAVLNYIKINITTIYYKHYNFIYNLVLFILLTVVCCTYSLFYITSKHMTLEYGGVHAIAMATRKRKAHVLVTLCWSPGTEQDPVDLI